MHPSRLAVCVGLAVTAVAALALSFRPRPVDASVAAPAPRVVQTTRDGLRQTIAAARARLAAQPAEADAAVRLAEALVRLARVESDGAHAIEAEGILKRVLDEEPGEYSALRMLGAVYLSQHRFRDAVDVAMRAMAVRPKDAWSYGVLGDAYTELGEYEQAFAAYDTMARLRPDAAAYARIAYAHELQGRLDDALTYMRRAAEATGAHDPESQAWHYAQLGHLHVERGELDAAAREYARADFTFPRHPYARMGLARVAALRGEHERALSLYRDLMEDAPTPEVAAAIGDLLIVTGDRRGGLEIYARAEGLEREGWKEEEPQPAALARLLAERGLKTDEAVRLAEQAAAGRSDIHTMDALAMAYYRAGRLDDAAGAVRRALRTGTRDRRIREHAETIARAQHR